MPEFRLPDLGEGLTEAEVVTWLVQVGDEVRVDQPVVEVETAKASVEVPVPFAGVVTELHGEPGAVLKVGAPLLTVETANAETDNAETDNAEMRIAEPGNAGTANADTGNAETAEQADSGNVLVGYGTSTSPRRHRARRGRRAAPSVSTDSGRTAVISPLVRRMARESGVDVASLTGSGPHGVVVRRDVEAATARSAPGAAPPVDVAGEERIPMRGVRRVMAEKMTRSRREIPEATVWVDVDATKLLAARAEMNTRNPDQQMSILALVSRFAVLGLRRHRELNGRLDGDEIVLSSKVNLGFAAQTDTGLVVPVVHGAEGMSARQLSTELSRLTDRARAGELAPADMTGGTFTVNNYGVFGVDGSAAIINYPEVAILGIGRIIDRPWTVDGQLAVRKVTELTLAFDHRVCDGGTAGGFLRFVADCIESPLSALAEM